VLLISLGQPIDGKGSLVATKPELVQKAPGIKSRARIDSPRPLESELLIVEWIGNGQRELLLD
jgi:F0F1-type ATP synthase alpha subunit